MKKVISCEYVNLISEKVMIAISMGQLEIADKQIRRLYKATEYPRTNNKVKIVD